MRARYINRKPARVNVTKLTEAVWTIKRDKRANLHVDNYLLCTHLFSCIVEPSLLGLPLFALIGFPHSPPTLIISVSVYLSITPGSLWLMLQQPS